MIPSFDPDSLPLPVGHFIGNRLLPAEGVIDMHPPRTARPRRFHPARTVVPVPALHLAYLVEVDAVAVIAHDAPAGGAGNSAE